MTKEKLKSDIISILDGWFGEDLDAAENDSRRKFLYEPILKAIDNFKDWKIVRKKD